MHVPNRVRSTGMRGFAIAFGVLMVVGLIAAATLAFAGSGLGNGPAQARVPKTLVQPNSLSRD